MRSFKHKSPLFVQCMLQYCRTSECSSTSALLRLLMPSGVRQDDDGVAYVAYSSEENLVMHISRLAPDYLAPLPTYVRRLINRRREAPSIFKHSGWYFMLTSGCTGWEPNRAEVFATRYRIKILQY